MPTVIPIEWRWGGGDTFAPLSFGSTVVTSRLNDGSPGDTSTFEQFLVSTLFSGSCQYNGNSSYITVIVDFGSVISFTGHQAQYTVAHQVSSSVTSCSPGGAPVGPILFLDQVERSTNASLWILMSGIFQQFNPTIYPSFATHSYTDANAFSARYLRFLFHNTSGGIGSTSGTINETLFLSDLRVFGTTNQQFINGTGFLSEQLGTGSLGNEACWTQECVPDPTGWSC